MTLRQDLEVRSGNKCELCASVETLSVFEIQPVTTGGGGMDGSILACQGFFLESIDEFKHLI